MVSDTQGNINFYDLRFTGGGGSGFEHVFQEEYQDIVSAEISQRPALETIGASSGRQQYLYAVGYVERAHRNQKSMSQQILDMDIHPSGNVLATSGQDKDVRFWTYPGAGVLENEIFHAGGQINPVDETYTFNQSHRQLNEEQSKIEAMIAEILRMDTKEGEDIFTREEVQRRMREFVSTADDRMRKDEEAEYIRERDMGGRKL